MFLKHLALAIAVICASSSLLEAQDRIVLPTRRPADVGPVSPPALPAGTDQITPVTILATFQGQRRQILRTLDKVLVVTKDREWLFERNNIDPRRVSATIVEHRDKSIVLYGESDVRNLLGLNGWADVIASTSENVLAAQKATTIESVRADIDSHLLRPCQLRFPSYRLLEVADWLESKH